MPASSLPGLIQRLLSRKPFAEFTIESPGTDPITVTEARQANIDPTEQLLYVTGWRKNVTTVVVLANITAVHATGEI